MFSSGLFGCEWTLNFNHLEFGHSL
uniref:Uncharacterized protein n=1 Tax=Anguilla anguilla TaxID=7936 RepID=A0A0E9RS29_ANGAN